MSIDRPRVSAVIATYNVADHIPGLRQRLAAMPVVDEIVIYDDASSDSTPTLLEGYAAADTRIKLVLASDNKGVAHARNEALTHCRGEFVWFADPDDEWSPDLVEILYQAAQSAGADIAVSRADQKAAARQQTYVVDGLDRWDVRDRAGTLDLMLTGAMRGYLWNKLLRRSIMPTAPFPAMRSQSDFVGLLRTVGRSGKTVFTPQVLYTRVERAGSITRTAKDQVENLRLCAAAMESILAEQGRLEQCAESLRYFRVWFFAIPAVDTPLRTGASSQLVEFGINSALDVIKGMPIRSHFSIARRAPRTEFRVICLLLFRRAYPAVYGAAKALRSMLRAAKR